MSAPCQRGVPSGVGLGLMKGTVDALMERVRRGKQRRRVARLRAALVATETQVPFLVQYVISYRSLRAAM